MSIFYAVVGAFIFLCSQSLGYRFCNDSLRDLILKLEPSRPRIYSFSIAPEYAHVRLVHTAKITTFKSEQFVTEIIEVENKEPPILTPSNLISTTIMPGLNFTVLQIQNPSTLNRLKQSGIGYGGKEKLLKMQSEAVEMALNEFTRRGWDETFKDHLRAFAQKHWHRSTYVIVRAPPLPDGKPGEIWGTFRLILSKINDGNRTTVLDAASLLKFGYLLPVEEYLGIILPRRQGQEILPLASSQVPEGMFDRLIVEPGNLAIKQDLNLKLRSAVAQELMGRTAALLMDKSTKKVPLYSYGDKTSVHLHSRLFDAQPVPTAPIVVNSKAWTLLQTDAEHFINAISENKTIWSSEELEKWEKALRFLGMHLPEN